MLLIKCATTGLRLHVSRGRGASVWGFEVSVLLPSGFVEGWAGGGGGLSLGERAAAPWMADVEQYNW